MKFEDCKEYKKCADGLYRYVYVTICTNFNYRDNFYIGKHRAKDIKNKYIGSGTLIKQYKKQFPNEYIKLILGTYLTDSEQAQAELYYISKYFNDPKCMNIGIQSSKGTTNYNHTEESRQKMSEYWSEYYKNHDSPFKGIKHSEEWVQKGKASLKEYYKTHENFWKGKHHSKETRKKLRESKLGTKLSEEHKKSLRAGKKRYYENESQEQKQKRIDRTKGTRYMTDGTVGHYLKPEEWGEFIDIGFYFKRKTKL